MILYKIIISSNATLLPFHFSEFCPLIPYSTLGIGPTPQRTYTNTNTPHLKKTINITIISPIILKTLHIFLKSSKQAGEMLPSIWDLAEAI